VIATINAAPVIKAAVQRRGHGGGGGGRGGEITTVNLIMGLIAIMGVDRERWGGRGGEHDGQWNSQSPPVSGRAEYNRQILVVLACEF